MSICLDIETCVESSRAVKPKEKGDRLQLEDLLGRVLDADGERFMRRIAIHIAKREPDKAIQLVHELIKHVHLPQNQASVHFDDPFAFICEDVRVVNMLENGGYISIGSVLNASDEELKALENVSRVR